MIRGEKLREAEYGLLFDIIISTSLQNVDDNEMSHVTDEEFRYFVRCVKLECERILAGVQEYEQAREEQEREMVKYVIQKSGKEESLS